MYNDERPEFRCPITLDIMQNPVIATDGHTYERSAIIQALTVRQVSPLTRQPMTAASLRSNHALRAEIEKWQQSHSQSTIPAFLPLTVVYVQPDSAVAPVRHIVIHPRPQTKCERCCTVLHIGMLMVIVALVGIYIYALMTAINLSTDAPPRRHLSG